MKTPGVVLTVFVLTGILVLSGCASAPPPKAPEISFTDLPAFKISARRPVTVVERYRPPLKAPHVEHKFRIVPAQIARAWARDRLDLVGSEGAVRLVILDGSVIEEEIETRSGVLGWFFEEDDRLLKARLAVRLEYAGENSTAEVETIATAERSVPEDVSLNELDEIYYDMIEDLAEVFAEQMDEQVATYFEPAFVIR